MREISIGERLVGQSRAPFVIAEAGINHNGDVHLAHEMCIAAHRAGADAVKFQTYRTDEFCGDPSQTYTYRSQGRLVTESMKEMFRRYELSEDEWASLKTHCDQIGITFFSTPQNPGDLALLLSLGVKVIKIGSDDLTNSPLIREYARCGLPLILSSGMSDLAEAHEALNAAGWYSGYPVAMLLCTSQYPTPSQDVNLAKLRTLHGAFPGLLTGFSDHTQGATAATLAVGLGARIFEKHFTMDRNLPGPDHWFSEDPTSLADWVRSIRTADQMLGDPFILPTPAEREMRNVARRSIVALRNIRAGDRLDSSNLGLRRPGGGLPPSMIDTFWGLIANRDICLGERISIGDVRG